MPKLRMRHAFAAALVLVAMLCQETWALAGVTGGISGYVRDADGAPVAAAKITVSSPSEVTSATTDASGHFAFLSLAPDTYTIAAKKEGYQDTALGGVTVFADQVQSVSVTMPKALRTIASVRSQAASSLIKSGVGGDIYNVDPVQMQKSAVLGGGGNLDNAYSAIASVPGLVVGTGGMGWNQAVVVRGSNPFFTGFEYDSIPVNRAFDNYTSSTASNLGLQELQVYTGGGPASISSTGTSGFINQVIKTGTYPGYGLLSGGVGTEAFYHSGRVEAGGATPNRTFSYYVGLSGYDQAYRYVDQSNGASYMTPGGVLGTYGTLTVNTPIGAGVLNQCPLGGYATTDPTNPVFLQGCMPQLFGLYGFDGYNTDRESIVNLHFGMPRKNGQRDDLQLLWSASAMRENFNSAPNDYDLNQFMLNATGLPYCPPGGSGAPGCAFTGDPNYPFYMDAFTYNLPFGTPIAGHSPELYHQPSSPANRAPFAQMPLDKSDNTNNDTGIVKAQWTHPLDNRSFVRLMGYTFFSDWTQAGASSAFTYDVGFAPVSPNYDLITHTSGAMLQYFNQLTDKHLLQFTGNYTHAGVVRFNNTGFLSPSYLNLNGCPQVVFGLACAKASPIGYISQASSGVYHCWDPVSGNEVSCLNVYSDTTGLRAYGGAIAAANGLAPTPANAAGFFLTPTRTGGSNAFVGPTGIAPPGSPAALAGAQWVSLWNGDASGTFNTVKPDFYSASLADQWRPTDKLTINASMRFDRFQYGLAPATVGQNPFYAQIIDNYLCYNPSINLPDLTPLAPGVFPPPAPHLEATCPAGYSHPGTGGVPSFTLNVPNTYSLNFWEPRISGTYTQNPDTVWRFSAGRYAEPPLSAAVEYLYRGGSAASLWSNFTELGFWSPFHPIAGQTSAQYDFSLEKRLHATSMSFKITPFYGTTSNWEQQSFIGAGFVTQIPVGRARDYGIEAQFNYGDFNKEGLSGLINFTWTQSQVQYQGLLGQNQIRQMNEVINNYNAMTTSAKCYDSATTAPNGFNAPDPGCSHPATDILNPYFGLPQQALLDENGWYPQGILALAAGGVNANPSFYNSPFVSNLILNYRHAKWSITPSLQFQAGTYYGSPLQAIGVDPSACGANQASTGVVAPGSPTAEYCDYTKLTAVGGQPGFGYLYIPNPQTGSFTNVGQYRQPNIAMLNLQLSYDVSPKVTLQLTAADVWHSCFGGSSEPWTKAYAPGSVYCGYTQNFFYVSNFYNGPVPSGAGLAGGVNGTAPAAGPNAGVTAYPWMLQSYIPGIGNGVGSYLPFNLYLQAQIKL